MWSTSWVFLGLVAIALSPATADYCNCGFGSGEDMCNNPGHGGGGRAHCAPLVVRPVELVKPTLPVAKVVCTSVGGAPPLVPIPGPCTCTKAIVKPAVVPRPVCTTCCHKVATSCSSSSHSQCNHKENCHSSHLVNSAPVLNYPQYYFPSSPSVAAPADAVSLSLAYKRAQQACVHNEDRLAFGFRKIPKELPPTPKKVNNIPEENLYSLNGQIVELKPVACAGKSLDEEAAEELLALSEEAIEPREIRKVSLGDIGYGPAKIASLPFVDVSVANPSEVAAEAAFAPNCKDGFIPGDVIFKTVPKPQSIVIESQVPCEHLEEYPDQPERAKCGCGSYFKSTSSSSCNKHAASRNVFLHKLGCL